MKKVLIIGTILMMAGMVMGQNYGVIGMPGAGGGSGSGADSMGVAITNDLLVFGTGTKAPKSYSSIGYYSFSGGLRSNSYITNVTSTAGYGQLENDGLSLGLSQTVASDVSVFLNTTSNTATLQLLPSPDNVFRILTTSPTVQLLGVGSSQNLGIRTKTFGTSAQGVLAIADGTAPTTSPSNSIQLWSESSELKVRDGAGNVTTLSPHNFSGIPDGPSEEMAWSFYSEKDGKFITVDMLRFIRDMERLTGNKYIYIGDIKN